MLTVNFNLFKIRDGDRFLDVGCGSGTHSYAAYRLNKDNVIIYAMDVDGLCLQRTKYVFGYMDKQNVSNSSWCVLYGDILRLPFNDSSIDKIICAEVLEHVNNPDQGVEEMVRILKPGGGVGGISTHLCS